MYGFGLTFWILGYEPLFMIGDEGIQIWPYVLVK